MTSRSLLLLVLLLCPAACGDGPDGAAPDAGAPSDAVPLDDGRSDGALAPDTDPTPDAPTCDADAPCAPTDACHAGTTVCETSGPRCAVAAPLPDGTSCGADQACDAGACRPGAPATLAGTCTYIDQPGWLSCPTGMACRCYYRYDKLFEAQPGSLDVWSAELLLDVRGGSIPANATMATPPAANIALTPTASGAAGNAYPYAATVTTTGELEVRLRATSGYVPAKSVLFSSADCGNRGKLLECTFASP